MEIALFEDCSELIEKFVRLKKRPFKSFCEVWKRCHFNYIFCPQTSYVEVTQTTSSIIYIAKIIFDKNYSLISNDLKSNKIKAKSFLRCVGGLYLMYTIYFKQPTRNYIKIDLPLNKWEDIKGFIDSLPFDNPDNDQIRYIFWELMRVNAFRFTALDNCLGLEKLVNYEDLSDWIDTDGRILSKFSSLNNVMTHFKKANSLISGLTALEDGYNEMKEILIENEQLDSQALPPTTIFTDIENIFNEIESLVNNSNCNENVTESLPSKKKDASETILDTRQALKQKAYSVDASNATPNTTERDKISVSPKPSTSAHSKLHVIQRRLSCKTIFSERLSENILKELESPQMDTDELSSPNI